MFPRAACRPLRLLALWSVIGWCLVAAVIYLSLAAEPAPLPPYPLADKLAHAAAYLLLMLWFTCIYVTRMARAWIALGLVAMGVVLELLQAGTPTRHLEVLDMFANASGVGVGLALAHTPLSGMLSGVERVLLRE